MKRLLFAILLISAILVSCGGQGKPAEGEDAQTSKADVSYAFGVAVGTNLKDAYLTIDYSAFLRGMKDVLDRDDPKMEMSRVQEIIQAAVLEAQAKRAADNAEKEKVFLAENAKKEGVKSTESGLQYVVINEGTGERPTATDTVRVHYTGTFTDGETFDSSVERGEPVEFIVGDVIPGWEEALQLMSVGSKYRLYIPSRLAYGEEGAGGIIPPNATLIFEVELFDIVKTE
ncbi:MAG TPA: FKBP-type peptidyl-prolyl cis-trans isomerase [Magnetospirillaceae bacterium]|nr:FKBP-type peptidyl-prolyl cis-trans isomerase [Magnetospirillaceae bacterium]